MLYLKTLGKLELHASGPDGPLLLTDSKPLAMLAMLAAMPERSGRRDYVAELLWQSADHAHARRSLRQALFRLSKQTGEQLVEAGDLHVTLDASRLRCDLWEMDRALEEGDYERVVTLYRGPFMAGLERKVGPELQRWIEAKNDGLQRALQVAFTRLIESAFRRDDASAAVKYARRYAELNPLLESAQLALVRALRAAGDDAGALRAYETYRSLLLSELGGEPSQELEEAIARIRDEVVGEPASARPNDLAPLQAPRDQALDHPTAHAQPAPPGIAGKAAAVAAAAVVLALGYVALQPRSRVELVIDPLEQLSGQLLVMTRGPDSEDDLLELVVLEPGSLEFRETGLTRNDRLSPAGTLAAFPQETRYGLDLAIRDLATGEVRTLTTGRADERPSHWSPDGRYLLYQVGSIVDEGGTYRHRLFVYDLTTGETRRLHSLDNRRPAWAVWSPDGTRIAFVAEVDGEPDLFVVRVDGTNLLNVSKLPGPEIHPAWSPDGQQLAFALSDSYGSDLFVVWRDGSGLRKLRMLTATFPTLAWIDEATVAYVDGGDEGRDLWALRLHSGAVRRLTNRGDVWSVRPGFWSGAIPWLDRVRIEPRTPAAAPGAYVELTAQVFDSDGRTRPTFRGDVRWSVTDSSVAALTGDGVVRLLRPGRTRVIASLAGWRADTVPLVSRPIGEREIDPLFVEDWTGGIRADRWIRYGYPLPRSRPSGGPEGGGVFINNGDRNYASGVVSRRAFPLADGLTVEAWGRAPFTGKDWENFTIGLHLGPPPADSIDRWKGAAVIGIDLQGQRSIVRLTHGASRATELPLPEGTESWHRYALQLAPDGTLTFLIDGRPYWRSSSPVSVDLDASVHVGLGQNSDGAEILHGLLRVYPGVKYEASVSGG